MINKAQELYTKFYPLIFACNIIFNKILKDNRFIATDSFRIRNSIQDAFSFLIQRWVKIESELTEYTVIKRKPVTLYVRVNDMGRIPRENSYKKQDFNLVKVVVILPLIFLN